MNFDYYKFRASQVGNLLVDGRSKNGDLSETTKTFLKKVYIAEVYKREEYMTNKYCQKGITVESDSLDLVSKNLGKVYFKNLKHFEDDNLQGTPDVITEDSIIDIKSSWNIWTFGSVSEELAKKTYYGQVLSYMILTGKKQAKLIYALTNTPEEIISYELYKLKASMAIKDTVEDEEKARVNYIFDDIEPAKRMKTFSFDFEVEMQNKLIERIKLSREYLNKLSL